jgi:putative ABC transport system ATP-binding protein
VSDSASAPLISLRQVVKTYGTGTAAFQALNGVDLDIREGEFVAIMGPSGSGKSTALNILGCLDAPSSGAYYFRDIRVDELTRNQRALLRRQFLGFVFQGFNLLARTSAQENVELPLLYRGEDAAHRHESSRQALAQVGLDGWEHHTPGELSGGQQQRVAIARALVHDPRLIVCDEPTSALDHETGSNVMALLKEVALHSDRALVIVTHDARIFGFADRIAEMDDGHIVNVKAVTADAIVT